jgi:hypothetical protein
MQPSNRAPELTIEEIAARSGKATSTVSAHVARWFAMQLTDRVVPRVRREFDDAARRWTYRVDAATYEAFRLRDVRPDVLPVCASEAARLLGCTCERIPLAGRMGVVIPEDCPVHEALAKAC